MNKRIPFLDNARTFSVYAALLASLCTLYAFPGTVMVPPLAHSGGLFLSNGLNRLSNWLYSFTPEVVFFICGYCTAATLRIRSDAYFLRHKFIRLAGPCLIGGLIAAPEMSYLNYLSNVGTASVISFFTSALFYKYYTEGTYIFITAALTLSVFSLLIKKLRPKFFRQNKSSPTILFFVLITMLHGVVSFLLFYIIYIFGKFIYPFDLFLISGWTLYFFIGIYAFKRKWFVHDGYIPSRRWLYFFVIVSLLFLFTDIHYFMWNFSFLITTSGVFAVLSFFAAYRSKAAKVWRTASDHAYGAYFTCSFLFFNGAYFLKYLQVPTLVAIAVLLIPGGIYAYFLNTHILLRLPSFKRQ